MSSTISDKLAEFKQIRAEFIQIANQFPKIKREEKLFSDWSLKDILFHIARWDKALAENLIDLKKGKEPPYYGTVKDFNDESTNIGKNLSWEETYKMFIENGKKLEKEWESLDENMWDKKFWSDKGSTPAKFLKINTHHYAKEHLPNLKTVLNSFK